MPDDVLVVVEVAEELFGVVVDVVGLLQEAGAEEVVEDLSQLGVALQVADVLGLDVVLYLPEVGLQLRVEVLVALHNIT